MKVLATLLLFFQLSLVLAQDGRDSLLFAKDFVATPSAPKQQVLLKVGAGLGYAGLTYLCYRAEDRAFQRFSQANQTTVASRVASAVSPLGLGEVNWAAWGATAGFAYLTRNARLQRTAYLWAGSLLINDLATARIKDYFQRHRPSTGCSPYVFDGHEGPNEHRSFPSSHTSTAFATATVFATVYRDKKWLPPLAYGMAAMVGASRVYDNAHWTSDVLAGAAVGFLSAKAMIGLDRLLAKKGIRVYPQLGRRSSVAMVYSLP